MITVAHALGVQARPDVYVALAGRAAQAADEQVTGEGPHHVAVHGHEGDGHRERVGRVVAQRRVHGGQRADRVDTLQGEVMGHQVCVQVAFTDGHAESTSSVGVEQTGER